MGDLVVPGWLGVGAELEEERVEAAELCLVDLPDKGTLLVLVQLVLRQLLGGNEAIFGELYMLQVELGRIEQYLPVLDVRVH